MTTVDDDTRIKEALRRVLKAYRESDGKLDTLPLEALFDKEIVSRPSDFRQLNQTCTRAASAVSSEALSHATAAVRIVFDIGRNSHTSMFRFFKCEGNAAA